MHGARKITCTIHTVCHHFVAMMRVMDLERMAGHRRSDLFVVNTHRHQRQLITEGTVIAFCVAGHRVMCVIRLPRQASSPWMARIYDGKGMKTVSSIFDVDLQKEIKICKFDATESL